MFEFRIGSAVRCTPCKFSNSRHHLMEVFCSVFVAVEIPFQMIKVDRAKRMAVHLDLPGLRMSASRIWEHDRSNAVRANSACFPRTLNLDLLDVSAPDRGDRQKANNR